MRSLSGISVDVNLSEADLREALARDVRTGLTSCPKSIPPTWFYDEEGSKLFEQITRLPEYYPTRAERALLVRSAGEVAALAGADTLIELGAGACDKTRILLDALGSAGSLRRYVPFDVSAGFLEAAASGVADEYEGLEVHAVVGDFLRHLDRIPPGGRRLVAFLGGTIGNLLPDQRRRFYRALARAMSPSDCLLLGTDLVKDRARILAAYDDRSGITAQFNRNVLRVLNRELLCDFDPGRFAHVALWNERRQWIEMRLRANGEQTVHVTALSMTVHLADGEEIQTEVSAKFTPDVVRAELYAADLEVQRQWGAEEGEFLLTLARPRE